ncbi:phage integrase N-terminal domain-containing protein [Idiomarina sp. HB]|uniref:phage integrase N-terminal domain-containing protein n=1 Tax=Idiomarina sp. HB TaxID=3110479 RepID=UPI003A80D9DC
MSQLGYTINQLIKKHRGGSFATQTASKRILNQIANELITGGFKLRAPNQLKPKHVEFLVTEWKRKELSSSTIKNRMSELRWLSRVIGKQNIILQL